MNVSEARAKYRRNRELEYSGLPRSELYGIVSSYENQGRISRIFSGALKRINYRVARKVLEERVNSCLLN